MKRFGAQGLFSYAVFFLCLSVVLFARAGEWWEAPDWRPTSNDEKAFVQDYPCEHQFLAACRQERVDVMEYWLSQKGFSPSDEFISGRTGAKFSGLWVASQKGYTDGVQLLIKAGADLNPTTDDGATPLFIASQNGRAEAVEILIQAGADLNPTTDDGATPLFIASQKGLVEVVEILVKAGADLNQARDDGVTPLLMASHNGHAEVVKILVNAGADLNQGKDNGTRPLYIASQNGHSKVVEILVKAGADLNQGKDNGTRPLYIASQNGHSKVVEILVKAGADLNQGKDNGTRPLYIASQNGHSKVVEILVKAGADLNQSNDGATPLFIASQKGHIEVVEILVNARANPTLKRHYNLVFTLSPLRVAKGRQPWRRKMNPEKYDRYDEVVEILKPAVKAWKEQEKIQAQIDDNTGCFDGFVCALKEGIKHAVAPLMTRAPLKSKGY